MYRLKLHKRVEKFLLGLSPSWRERFREKLEILRENPFDHARLDIKPMQGMGDAVYRLRIGPYRAIYQVRDADVTIYLLTAGTRGDVYK